MNKITELKKTLAKYSKLELATMVAELTDGLYADDIHGATGMNMGSAEIIVNIGHELGEAIF